MCVCVCVCVSWNHKDLGESERGESVVEELDLGTDGTEQVRPCLRVCVYVCACVM